MSISPSPVRALLLAYVAQRFAPEERERFEQRLLDDAAFSEEVEAAEFSLLDEYVRQTLPRDEHDAVRDWVARSPWHARSVAVSEALLQAGSRKPVRSWFLLTWPVRLAAMALLVIAVALPLWTWRHSAAGRGQVAVLTPQPAVTNPVPSASSSLTQDVPFHGETILLQAQTLRGVAGRPSSAAFSLRPGTPLRLQIVVPRDTPAQVYGLSLQEAGEHGSAHRHWESLTAGNAASLAYVQVSLPDGLSPGRYTAALTSPTYRRQIPFTVLSRP